MDPDREEPVRRNASEGDSLEQILKSAFGSLRSVLTRKRLPGRDRRQRCPARYATGSGNLCATIARLAPGTTLVISPLIA